MKKTTLALVLLASITLQAQTVYTCVVGHSYRFEGEELVYNFPPNSEDVKFQVQLTIELPHVRAIRYRISNQTISYEVNTEVPENNPYEEPNIIMGVNEPMTNHVEVIKLNTITGFMSINNLWTKKTLLGDRIDITKDEYQCEKH